MSHKYKLATSLCRLQSVSQKATLSNILTANSPTLTVHRTMTTWTAHAVSTIPQTKKKRNKEHAVVNTTIKTLVSWNGTIPLCKLGTKTPNRSTTSPFQLSKMFICLKVSSGNIYRKVRQFSNCLAITKLCVCKNKFDWQYKDRNKLPSLYQFPGNWDVFNHCLATTVYLAI